MKKLKGKKGKHIAEVKRSFENKSIALNSSEKLFFIRKQDDNGGIIPEQ
jgi:hypothetical protein